MTEARAKVWDKEVGKLDTEDLITEIQKEPAIWNSSLEDYSDKIAKRNAWSNVITAFFPDFAEKSQEDKRILGSVFQRRWKSLRDGYSRENLKRKSEQKSGSAATGRKSYVYYEQLRFLETLAKPTKNSMEDGGDGQAEDLDDADTQEPEEVTRPAKRSKAGNKKEKDSDDDILMKALKEQLLKKSVDANNEDRLFMLSLVPELQKVPDCMKLEAKSRLIAVFSQIRLEMQRMNSSPQQQNYYSYNYNYPVARHNFGGNPQGPPPQTPRLQVAVPVSTYQPPSTSNSINLEDLSPTFSTTSSELDFATL